MVTPIRYDRVDINVLLIDEPPPGQSFARVLASAGANIVGTYGYGRHIAATARTQDCDIIVVGLRHPLSRSLRAVEYASLASSEAPVLAFAEEGIPGLLSIARQAMQAGARDMVTIPIDRQELDLAMRQAILIEERRRLVQSGSLDDIQPQGEICVLFGARGGAGASSFGVNLGYAHATQSDERVVFLDTRSGVGGVDGLITPNLLKPIPTEYLEAIEGGAGEALFELEPQDYQGLAVVRGGDALRNMQRGSEGTYPVVSIINALARIYDYIYVDVQPPWSDEVLAVFETANTVVLLVTPEFSTVASAKVTLDAVSEVPLLRDRIVVVLNHAGLPGGMQQGEIEKALNSPIAWEVVEDPQANVASQLGRPLVEVFPDAKASRSLTGLLFTLTGVRSPVKRGGWQRLTEKLLFGRRRRAVLPMQGSR